MSRSSTDESSIGEMEILAVFERRNGKTGAHEQARITTNTINGRQITHLRIWWQPQKPTPEDDGWRPTKEGVTLRESELDEAIESLVRARDIVHSEGRATRPAAPGERNLRPRTVARVLALVEAKGVSGLSDRDLAIYQKMQSNMEDPP